MTDKIFGDNPLARAMLEKWLAEEPNQPDGPASEKDLYDGECQILFESPLGRMGLTKIMVVEVGYGDEGGPFCLTGFFSTVGKEDGTFEYELVSLIQEFDTWTTIVWKRMTPYDTEV